MPNIVDGSSGFSAIYRQWCADDAPTMPTPWA